MFTKSIRVGIAMLAVLLLPLTASASAQPRDNDGNAMIWGGAYTKTELIQNLENGDGHGHTAKQLQAEFHAHGITLAEIRSTHTVNGEVTKSGEVIVGGKTVATGAQSYGRDNLTGSTKEGDLYLRSTSVSFQSAQIPAFVHMTDAGRFDYAIVKSCGNIVTAQPVAVAAKPKPVAQAAPTPVIIVAQSQTQTQTQTAPAPQPVAQVAAAPAPAPQQLPQTGPGLVSLAGLSALLTGLWYYQRSRRSLRAAHLAPVGHRSGITRL
jgi:LPXTG-motif cell wall-anchored protein